MNAPEGALAKILACPRCGTLLARDTSGKAPALACAPCNQRYPLIHEIPWLFEAPEAELIEWKARATATIQAEGAQVAALSAQLKEKSTLASGRKRVESL